MECDRRRSASDNPRWEYARHRFLYKLYVVRPLAKADESAADDPTPEFMRVFLPEVQKCLFGPTTPLACKTDRQSACVCVGRGS